MPRNKDDLEHRPIEPHLHSHMNALAAGLNDILNGKDCKKGEEKLGFALLIFPFGDAPEGRVNYISNAQRKDMIVALKEFIARNEGRYHPAPEQDQ